MFQGNIHGPEQKEIRAIFLPSTNISQSFKIGAFVTSTASTDSSPSEQIAVNFWSSK